MAKEGKGKEKQIKSLFSYAVIFLIGIIIVIIFAAMADGREKTLITNATSTNEVIQNELISAKDEIYSLKAENDTLKASAGELERIKELDKVWYLYKEGKTPEAKDALSKIPTEAMGESENAYYNALCEILNFRKEDKQ